MTESEEAIVVDTERQRDELVERLFAASLGMGELLTVYLGDTLGFYRTLDRVGAMSSAELAKEAGTSERLTREWLEQQAAAGILDVDDVSADADARRYLLPAGHAEPLLDLDSPYSMAPVCKSFVAISSVTPELVAAFRSGGEVPWSSYGRDMIEAQGDFNRPWLVASLGTEYMPSIPDIHDGCRNRGRGWPTSRAGSVGPRISLARAYPNITVDGFDLDELSIEIASKNAEEAGVADRVRFEAKDAADTALENRYDLAMVVESIHDMSQPVAVLGAIRNMLKPGGTLIVADERTEDAFTAPASETERFFYAYSVLCCLPSALDDETSAATGTVMRRSTFERYAKDAGFDGVSVLPIEHDFLRFYRLDR